MKLLLLRLTATVFVLGFIITCLACGDDGEPRGPRTPDPLPSEIPALISMLGDENRGTSSSALDALVDRGEEAVPELIGALGSEPQITEGATWALARIGTPAVPNLVEALNDSRSAVRDACVVALTEIGPQAAEAVPVLVELLLRIGTEYERIHIIYALAAIAPASPEVLEAYSRTLDIEGLRSDTLKAIALLGPLAESLATSVIAVLNTEEKWTTCALAIETLGAIGPVHGVPAALSRSLEDEQDGIRSRAADALGTLGPEAAWTTPSLVAVFSDDVESVHRAAIQAVGNLAPDSIEGIPGLVQMLSHEIPQTRREAVNALEKFGSAGSEALDALRLVAQNDEFDYVRTAARQAVEAIEGSG